MLVSGAVVGREVGKGGASAAAAAAGPFLVVAALWWSNTAKRGLERELTVKAGWQGNEAHTCQ